MKCKIKAMFFGMIFSMLVCMPASASKLETQDLSVEEVQEYKEEAIDDKIPQGATKYAEEHVKDILELSMEYMNLDIKPGSDYLLGTPFVICDKENTDNSESYYYPVIVNDKIVLVLSVMNTSEGWTISGSEEFAEELTDMDYAENDSYVFYEDNEELVAVDGETEYCLSDGAETVDETPLVGNEEAIQEYSDSVQEVSEYIDSLEPVNISEINKATREGGIAEGYTPKLNSNNKLKSCALHNAKGQGAYNLCWAASVATIVNYRQGKNLSAKQICDKMNVDYYTGRDIDFKKKALAAYKISYAKTEKQLSWAKIQENINKKYPIAVGAYAKKTNGKWKGHAVTVYGHNTISAKKNLIVWDPKTVDGKGGSTVVQYKSGGSTFERAGMTFTWTNSLSQYK